MSASVNHGGCNPRSETGGEQAKRVRRRTGASGTTCFFHLCLSRFFAFLLFAFCFVLLSAPSLRCSRSLPAGCAAPSRPLFTPARRPEHVVPTYFYPCPPPPTSTFPSSWTVSYSALHLQHHCFLVE